MTLTIKISHDGLDFYQDSYYYDSIPPGRNISYHYEYHIDNHNTTIVVIASGEELKKCCSILGRDMPFSPSERRLANDPTASPGQLKKLLEKEYTFYGGNAREIVSNWDNWQ